MSGDIENDDVAVGLRDEITACDVELLDLVNRRIELVERLRNHKVEHGYPMIDAAREDWLVGRLLEANSGPISDGGIRHLVEQVIALVRAEVYQRAGIPPPRG